MENPHGIIAPPAFKSDTLFNQLDVVVLDVETTGLEFGIDRICEIAAVKISQGKASEPFYSLVDPEMYIPPKASSIHGISNYSLAMAKAPTLDAIIDPLVNYIGDSVIVAHNAAFDRAFVNPAVFLENGYTRTLWKETPDDLVLKNAFGGVGREWLCSYRLACHCFQKHFGYTDVSLANEALRYWLEPKYIRTKDSHNALNDTLTTVNVFRHILSYAYHSMNIKNLDELFALQHQSIAKNTLSFGKHRGSTLQEVPYDYLIWALNNHETLDYELAVLFEEELNTRLANQNKTRSNVITQVRTSSASSENKVAVLNHQAVVRTYDKPDGNVTVNHAFVSKAKESISPTHNERNSKLAALRAKTNTK